MERTGKNMKFRRTQKGIDYLLWIGNDSIYIWNRKENKEERIDLSPAENIPYIPKFHTVWDETYSFDTINRALGGNPWIHIKRVMMAVPDDITRIERQALTEFALMAGIGRKLALCSQSLLLSPLAARYISITWSCRCFSICLVNNGIPVKKSWVGISNAQSDLIAEIKNIDSGENLPVFYPQIEEPPFPIKIGDGLSLERLAKSLSGESIFPLKGKIT